MAEETDILFNDAEDLEEPIPIESEEEPAEEEKTEETE